MKLQKLTHKEVMDALPDRAIDAHKGDFGKIMLICGSKGYTGAAELAAKGALRCGAGLVYLVVPESIYMIEAIKLTEPIVISMPDERGMLSACALDQILALSRNMDAVLIGPGLGKSEGTWTICESILSQFDGPVVLDADGINLVSEHKDILHGRTAPTILTPHAGEFSRLHELGVDRVRSAVDLASQMGCIVLLKGHETVITDGSQCYINPTGNPGMAVGGSGDLLAGMITSLLGQGIEPLKAAAVGAWLHGKAGDICASEIGQYGMLPTDLLQVLPRLLK